jgi:hypothetical protein
MTFETADYNDALFAEWFYSITYDTLVEFDRKLDRLDERDFAMGCPHLHLGTTSIAWSYPLC